MARKIYLASSWRNEEHPVMVEFLRAAGHEVYDFRHPHLGVGQPNGFRWSDIDPEWEAWTPEQYREALKHPIAVDGFAADKGGMDWADVCVMLAPCGRSAHTEAAYMAGQGKPSIAVLRPGEPELMYGLFSRLVITDEELLNALAALAEPAPQDVEEARYIACCDDFSTFKNSAIGLHIRAIRAWATWRFCPYCGGRV